MNEELINPFNTLSHPTTIQTTIPAQALFSKFDTTGRYIATGRTNGSAHVWDLETRNSIRWLDGHVKPVTSLDWSRNSRYLLTSSKDWNVVIWDLASACDPPQRYTTLRFDAPVVSASFHPKNSKIILVLLTTGEAFVCDTRKETRSKTMLKELDDESEDEDGESSSRVKSYMTVARFDPSGKHIFVGTSNGMILVFRTRTKAMIARHKVSGANILRGLEFTKSGRRFVTNSSDRTLRQFNVPTYPDEIGSGSSSGSNSNSNPNTTNGDAIGNHQARSPDGVEHQPLGLTTPSGVLEQDLEPTHRFNDPINKTAWHAMAFSPDGEWLAGGAADPAAHKIYVWDLSNDGQFASTLDGGREPLSHLHWHPTKSIIGSTTNQGNVLIWHYPNPERWGAFAGGFEEVDENIEYEEKEDEFDIEDEAVLLERKMKSEEVDVDIDSMVVDNVADGLGSATRRNSSTPNPASNPNNNTNANTTDGNPDDAPTNADIDIDVDPKDPLNTSNGNGTDIPPPPLSSATSATLQGGSATPTDPDIPMGATTPAINAKAKEEFAEVDPDILWAEEDPDDDLPGLWRMRVLMEDDEDEL